MECLLHTENEAIRVVFLVLKKKKNTCLAKCGAQKSGRTRLVGSGLGTLGSTLQFQGCPNWYPLGLSPGGGSGSLVHLAPTLVLCGPFLHQGPERSSWNVNYHHAHLLFKSLFGFSPPGGSIPFWPADGKILPLFRLQCWASGQLQVWPLEGELRTQVVRRSGFLFSEVLILRGAEITS